MKSWLTLKEKIIRHSIIKTWSLWEKLGFFVVPRHFYWPIPAQRDLLLHDFDKQFPLDGINLNDSAMLSVLEEIKKYREEYSDIYTESGYESNGDGAILYGMVRKLKPKKIIEIGSGYSTRVSSAALCKNEIEGDGGGIVAIEPYPKDILINLVKKNKKITLIQKKVEELGLEQFKELNPGDILFIDSSHNVKCGNDVHFIYLYLLPQIPVGTIIHAHDIRFPYEYPKNWLLDSKYFWNEQYLLQMFLAYNDSFEVLFAGNYMNEKYPEVMQESLVGLSNSKDGWPGCFWFERIK